MLYHTELRGWDVWMMEDGSRSVLEFVVGVRAVVVVAVEHWVVDQLHLFLLVVVVILR